VDIGAADAGHFGPHQRSPGFNFRQREFTQNERAFKMLKDRGACNWHGRILPGLARHYNSICFRRTLSEPNEMPKQYWLVKQEPDAYSWETFVKDGSTAWTGVRNFQARNNLRAMKKGDAVFYYHSNVGKEIVGVARVIREAYADPTADDGDWSAVDIAPVKAVKNSVTLMQMKADTVLKNMALVRNSRISVTPVTLEQAERVLKLAETEA
jgi:predicted RNA-binding protein with PUA-like domain